jgi:hypothetical protein
MYRSHIISFVLIFSGCFYIGQNRMADIVTHSSQGWSESECVTIIMESMLTNFVGQSTSIWVYATPFTPDVILAINRSEQKLKHLSEQQFRKNVDEQLNECLGLHIDWDKKRYFDSKGNYLRDKSQIDSITFLITLDNSGWSYTIPDISNLEQNIYLESESGEKLKPLYVWGKHGNLLMWEETLLAKFRIKKPDSDYFNNKEFVYLVIDGFSDNIKLKFGLAKLATGVDQSL